MRIFSFLIFFFLSSNINGLDIFHAWDIHFIKIKSTDAPEIISRPAGTRVLLASWRVKSKEKNCLFYKIPLKKKRGVLGIQSLKSCIWDPQVREEILLDKIEFLKIHFSLEEKKLIALYKRKGLKKKIEWDVPNYATSRKIGRYSQTLIQRSVPGVFFPGDLNGIDHLLGEKKDNYKDGNSIVCHQFDKKCFETQTFRCDKCRFGWYEVVGAGCAQGAPKYCGVSRCGARGQPACPRGYQSVRQIEAKQICSTGSVAGFCQKGLKTYCDENRVLICR